MTVTSKYFVVYNLRLTSIKTMKKLNVPSNRMSLNLSFNSSYVSSIFLTSCVIRRRQYITFLFMCIIVIIKKLYSLSYLVDVIRIIRHSGYCHSVWLSNDVSSKTHITKQHLCLRSVIVFFRVVYSKWYTFWNGKFSFHFLLISELQNKLIFVNYYL